MQIPGRHKFVFTPVYSVNLISFTTLKEEDKEENTFCIKKSSLIFRMENLIYLRMYFYKNSLASSNAKQMRNSYNNDNDGYSYYSLSDWGKVQIVLEMFAFVCSQFCWFGNVISVEF